MPLLLLLMGFQLPTGSRPIILTFLAKQPPKLVALPGKVKKNNNCTPLMSILAEIVEVPLGIFNARNKISIANSFFYYYTIT